MRRFLAPIFFMLIAFGIYVMYIESVTRLPEALGDTTAKPPHSGQPQLARSRLARGWFSSPLQ
jgi:hypothetical protein